MSFLTGVVVGDCVGFEVVVVVGVVGVVLGSGSESSGGGSVGDGEDVGSSSGGEEVVRGSSLGFSSGIGEVGVASVARGAP